MDSLTEGCQIIGPDWTYLYVNAAAARQGRRTRAELLGRTMMECYPGIEKTAVFPLIRHCMEQRSSHTLEHEFQYPDGGSAWFELRIEPVPHGVFVLSLEITERKQSVQEWLRLSTAIEQTAESVVLTSSSGEIQYVNPAFERITGYRREDVLGRNPRLLSSGKHDEAFYQALWKTVKSGETWRGLLQNRRKDGAVYTQDTSISPVTDDSGAVVGFVGVGRDVTVEIRVESDLRQSQKMEAIGRLAGGVAHDFNNLLSRHPRLRRAVAMEELRESDPLRDDIEQIRQAGERAAALTRQLLAFSRQQVLQPRVLDLNDGGRESMAGCCAALIGEDIELEIGAARRDLGTVQADPGRSSRC